jgi:hypothetical protein
LGVAVLEDVEVVASEAADQPSVRVADRDRDAGDVDARLERARILDGRLPGRQRQGDRQGEKQQRAADMHLSGSFVPILAPPACSKTPAG